MKMNELMPKPVNEFAQALFSTELADIAEDFAELGVDSLFDNPVLKEIPLVKTAVSILKLSVSIKDRFEIKKQLAFIQQVNSGVASTGAVNKRRKAYQNREKWYYDEAELSVVYLSRHTRLEKVKIQAELYLDYINGVVDADEYLERLDVLDSLMLSDVPLLLDIYEEQADFSKSSEDFQEKLKNTKTTFDASKCGRLYASGLITPVSRGFSFGANMSNNYLITDLGVYFCEIVMRVKSKHLNA